MKKFIKRQLGLATAVLFLVPVFFSFLTVPTVNAADDGFCEASEVENFILQETDFLDANVELGTSVTHFSGERKFFWMHSADNADCDNKEYIIGARVQGSSSSFLPYLFDGTGGSGGVYRGATYDFDDDPEGAGFEDGESYQFRLYVYGGSEEQALTVLSTINDITYDTTDPVLSSVVLDNYSFDDGDNTAIVTFTFDEEVIFVGGDVNSPNGSISDLEETGDPTIWTATFTADDDTDTTGQIFTSNTWTDLAGNRGNSVYSSTYSIDTENPTLDITLDDVWVDGDDDVTVEFDFSESVTGFDLTDVTLVENGSLSNFSGSGDYYTATFTPDADVDEDLTNVIRVDMTGLTDSIGNAGVGTEDSENYAVDTTDPTIDSINISSDEINIADGSMTVTFTFSERPYGFDEDDLDVDCGTIDTPSVTGDPTVWTAEFTPYEDTECTEGDVVLNSGGWYDFTGNLGDSNSSSYYDVDTLAPTLIIDIDDTDLEDGDTATVTFTFSENVSGFTNGDITVPAGATLTPVATGDNVVYTATLTPDDDTTALSNVLEVDMTGVVDGFSNPGSGTEDSESYDVDTVVPSVTITMGDSEFYADDTTTVTFTFTEDPYNFDSSDVTVENGSISGLAVTGDSAVWTATFTPDQDIDDDTNIISVGTSWNDEVGNDGVGDDSDNYVIDTLPATVVVTMDSSSLGIGDTATVTFTFDEEPIGFTIDDVTVENGELGAIDDANPLIQVAAFTPDDDVEDVTNLITVGTDWQDDNGNDADETNSDNYVVDTVRPELVSIELSDYSLGKNQTPEVTFTFSESVAGSFSNADIITIENGTLSAVVNGGLGTVWTATFTPTGNLVDNTNVIIVDMTTITDLVGNEGEGDFASDNYIISTRSSGSGGGGGGGGSSSDNESDEDTTAVETESDESSSSSEGSTGFGDVAGHWAQQYIEQLFDMGVVTGKTDTTFEPDVALTRAEMIKIAMLAFGHEIDTELVESFPDVDPDAWYATYLANAKVVGIATGYNDGLFRPDAPITRAEALKILLVAAKADLTKFDESPFSDLESEAWYIPYVVYAYNMGIVSGKEDDIFAPNDYVTRAEMTKMAVKTVETH